MNVSIKAIKTQQPAQNTELAFEYSEGVELKLWNHEAMQSTENSKTTCCTITIKEQRQQKDTLKQTALL